MDRINKLAFSLVLLMFTFVVGCDSDPFPLEYVYMIDQKNQTCDQYKVSDIENVKFKYDKPIPFEKCPISFGFTKTDTGKLMSWIRRQKKNIGEE